MRSCLQRSQIPGKSLRQRVQCEPQLLERRAQFVRGHRDEASLEAVQVLQLGHIFEHAHRAQQLAVVSRIGVVRSR